MVTIPDGYGQLSVIHETQDGVGESVWTLGFQNTGDDDAAACVDVYKSTFVASDYWDALSTTTDVTELRVKLGPSDTGPSAVTDVNLSGTNGGVPVGPQVSFLLTKNTALGGRRGRGRAFLPGHAATSLTTSGFWDPAHVSFTVSEVTSIILAAGFAGLTPVLLHSSALTPTPITSLSGATRIATQRRRNRR